MITKFRVILIAGVLSAATLAGQTVGVLRSGPLPSPQDMAALETRVLQNPEDIEARTELLQLYLDTALPSPGVDSARRSVRLQHILYLVEHHPEATASASRAAYVYRTNGPYANASDHDVVRNQWLAAVQGHPGNTAVMMNAVRFLEREDLDDAENVLRRVLDAAPDNREVAAHLGFIYAVEILGSDLAAHATVELEQSSNAIVLAAAGTALPNLAKGIGSISGSVFDLASQLSERARQLAPDDADIQGPMPLIKYFVAAEDTLRGAVMLPSAPTPPAKIRLGAPDSHH